MMRRLLFLLPILLFVAPAESEAQRVDSLLWIEYGFGYLRQTADHYTLYNGDRVPGRRLHVGADGGFGSVGFYMPIVEFSPGSSIGLNVDAMIMLGTSTYDPAFPGTISHLDQSSGAYQFALPLLAMVKTGSDAMIIPRSPFGLGAGVGLRPTLIPGLGDFYVAPIVSAEISYALEITLLKLRAHYTPLIAHPIPEVDLRTLDVGIYFVIGR